MIILSHQALKGMDIIKKPPLNSWIMSLIADWVLGQCTQT